MLLLDCSRLCKKINGSYDTEVLRFAVSNGDSALVRTDRGHEIMLRSIFCQQQLHVNSSFLKGHFSSASLEQWSSEGWLHAAAAT